MERLPAAVRVSPAFFQEGRAGARGKYGVIETREKARLHFCWWGRVDLRIGEYLMQPTELYVVPGGKSKSKIERETKMMMVVSSTDSGSRNICDVLLSLAMQELENNKASEEKCMAA